jgi:multimeric flavodoxin WrbA
VSRHKSNRNRRKSEKERDDDVSKLAEEIAEADAVVFGSPAYFVLFTGQFKLMEIECIHLSMQDLRSSQCWWS